MFKVCLTRDIERTERCRKLAEVIDALAPEYKNTDAELKAKTEEFRAA